MKSVAILIFLLAAIACLIWRCTKPYRPAEITANYNYLVVEGVINNGTDSTVIKLSRTVKLTESTGTKPELKAIISLENDKNSSVTLKETANGKYVTGALLLDNTAKYRVRIKTVNGKTYLSDFVAVKNAPPIDSVGYTIQSDGINIYANTHDPANKTTYYRWEYTEDWQFHAKYNSNLISNGKDIVSRPYVNQIHDCFGNDASSTIVLASSAKLIQDVIYQTPITTIASTSEKIETKYSILLKQFALTSDAFEFWSRQKKNTEQLGSIFDAQPTELTGNIHNINDASDLVIGYISVGTVQTKRIFIPNTDLPPLWRPTYPFNCEVLDSAYYRRPYPPFENDVKDLLLTNTIDYYPIGPFSEFGGGYLYTTRACADCTIRGVVKQPIFWK